MALGEGKPFSKKAMKIISSKYSRRAGWLIIQLKDFDGKEYTNMIGANYQGMFRRAIEIPNFSFLNCEECVGKEVIAKFNISGAIDSFDKVG